MANIASFIGDERDFFCDLHFGLLSDEQLRHWVANFPQPAPPESRVIIERVEIDGMAGRLVTVNQERGN